MTVSESFRLTPKTIFINGDNYEFIIYFNMRAKYDLFFTNNDAFFDMVGEYGRFVDFDSIPDYVKKDLLKLELHSKEYKVWVYRDHSYHKEEMGEALLFLTAIYCFSELAKSI